MDTAGLFMAPSLKRAEFDEVVDLRAQSDIRERIFVASEILASNPVAYRGTLAEYREAERRDGDVGRVSPVMVMPTARRHRSGLAPTKKRRAESDTSVFTFECFGIALQFQCDSPDLGAAKACFTQGTDS